MACKLLKKNGLWVIKVIVDHNKQRFEGLHFEGLSPDTVRMEGAGSIG
jgi:hypothetical protein